MLSVKRYTKTIRNIAHAGKYPLLQVNYFYPFLKKTNKITPNRVNYRYDLYLHRKTRGEIPTNRKSNFLMSKPRCMISAKLLKGETLGQ